MPAEIEVPTEHLHETLHETAHREGGGFTMQVALSSALLAVLAAACALFAGAFANEALLARVKASDQWAYYQAKGIKANVLASKLETLQALGRRVADKDQEKLAEYKKEQEDIRAEAEKLERESESALHRHEILARGVTLFQVAIALAAIAVLTKKRPLWLLSILLGLGVAWFLAKGLLHL